MKNYTDIEQAKKLAEILPLESADMYYITFYGKVDKDLPIPKEVYDIIKSPINKDKITLAWSLAALLGVLPDSIYDNTDEFSQLEFTKKSVAYIQGTTNGIKIGALKDNLVDACYEMILKLNKFNLL